MKGLYLRRMKMGHRVVGKDPKEASLTMDISLEPDGEPAITAERDDFMVSDLAATLDGIHIGYTWDIGTGDGVMFSIFNGRFNFHGGVRYEDFAKEHGG